MSDSDNKSEFKEVPIKWHVPDNIITRYASNITVQILENEFRISFFEIKPKIELEQRVSEIEEVHANCVADIFMSPAKIPNLIDALQRQYNQFLKRPIAPQ